MGTEQLTEGTKLISNGMTGVSNIITNIINYFGSLGWMEIAVLVMFIGTSIFLWIIINKEKQVKQRYHQY
jgi:hypothetical protein